MDKRVLIFSPYERDRQELVNFVKDYFNRKFDLPSFSISAYHALFAPEESDRLGHHDEVLVIFDQRLVPEKRGGKIKRKPRDDLHPDYVNKDLRDEFLKMSLDASKNLCDSKDIPYIFYKGDFEKDRRGFLEVDGEKLLEERLDSVYVPIRKKLVA